jgi:hypothetical protein
MIDYNQEDEMRAKEIKKEFERDDREAGMEKLLHLSYDALADGGRHHRERIARKVVDPEIAAIFARLYAN